MLDFGVFDYNEFLKSNVFPIFWQIIEECESRMEGKIEGLIETITQMLPPHPSQVEKLNEEETAEGEEENGAPEANTED